MSEDQKPLIASIWRDLALDHIKGRRYERAVEDVKKALTHDPGDALSLAILGGVKVVLGEPGSALVALAGAAYELEPSDANIFRLRGAALRRMDDCERALFDLSHAFEMKPDDGDTLILRGHTYMLLEKYEEADADLQKAQALTHGLANYIVLALRGGCKRMLGKYDEALTLLMSARCSAGTNKFILRSICDVLNTQGRYLSTLCLPPTNDAIRNDAVGRALIGEACKMLDDFALALWHLDAANWLKPNDAYILALRGDVRRMRRDYELALVDLNHADSLKPDDAFTLKIRGAVKNRLGKFKEALDDLNRAYDKHPSDDFTVALRGELERVNTCGITRGIYRCIRVSEVMLRKCPCGLCQRAEPKAVAPPLNIRTTELCDLDSLIVELTLDEMALRKAGRGRVN
jgi:tetratricopeptide (TPR) repeat protein